MSVPSQGRSARRHKGEQRGSNGTALSRKLSWILRHGAVEAGLDMDAAGYVNVAELLAIRAFQGYNVQDIRRAVHANDKQRFSLREVGDALYIRANQGHSGEVAQRIDPEKLLQRVELADLTTSEVCVHGTSLGAWEQIGRKGLSRMKRQMIHFATGLPEEGGAMSGMRNSSTVVIHVDIRKAVHDGIPFFRSDNNVLLTPGLGHTGCLPLKYFQKVERRDTGQILHESPAEHTDPKSSPKVSP